MMTGKPYLLALIMCLLAAASAFAAAKVPDWILREKFVRACADGDTATVKKLLDEGVAADSRDLFGQPAIFRAVGRRADYDQQVEILRLLLAAGVDINTRNKFGSTPIFITAGNHYRPSPPHLSLWHAVRTVTSRTIGGSCSNSGRSIRPL